MKVGWNGRYIFHCLVCLQWVFKSVRLSALATAVLVIIFAFPIPTGIGVADVSASSEVQPAVLQASLVPVSVLSRSTTPAVSPAAVAVIDSMLAKYNIRQTQRERVARAVVASSRKYNLDSKLVASIVIVESGVDPHAISEAHSIGLMQIHLPTWGSVADKQGIDLFKIEDNVELGSKILKGYISKFGLWDGVAHYTGSTDAPESQQAAADYVRKVQKIYGYVPD
jgi:soluble lytic murein transglycosylase-like protein